MGCRPRRRGYDHRFVGDMSEGALEDRIKPVPRESEEMRAMLAYIWWLSSGVLEVHDLGGVRRTASLGERHQPTKISLLTVISVRCPEHTDATVQAVGEDVIGRQGHEGVIV